MFLGDPATTKYDSSKVQFLTRIMVFMRKCLLIFLLSVCWLLAENDSRALYLKLYYDGDYQKAHAILRNAFSDPLELQIWEERLHLQQQIKGCIANQSLPQSVRGLALLRMGDIDAAKKEFAEDIPSIIGLATLSLWQNDSSTAHELIQRGLKKDPSFPEFLFLAGNLAENDEEALEYFHKYLAQKPSDQLKVLSAQQAIDFVSKTRGVPLNVASIESPLAVIDSKYDSGRMIMKAKLNEKEPLNLLVDTGAAGISLEKKDWGPKITSDLLMIGLGKDQKSAGQRVVFDTFSTGAFQIRNPVAAVSDTLQAKDVDGILGSVVFSKCAVLLPLKPQKSLMLITQPASEWLQQNVSGFQTHVTLPFYLVNKMMIVKGAIKKSEPQLDMLIDTGAFRTVLSTAAAKKYAYIDYPLSRTASQRPELFGLNGRVEDFLVADNVEIKLGSIQKEFNRMLTLNLAEISEALELEIDAILGQDFLDGYTLLIDYRDRTITFLK